MRTRTLKKIIVDSGFFDEVYYLKNNRDARLGRRSPIDHYCKVGIKYDLKPNDYFDPLLYRTTYQVGIDSEVYPLIHFIQSRKDYKELIEKDNKNIEQKNRLSVSNQDNKIYTDYDEAFDGEFYLKTYPDIKKAGIDARKHYSESGWKEGRKPNDWFDPGIYINNYDDVRELGIDPLEHYINIGQYENREFKRIPKQNIDPFQFQFNQNNSKSEKFIDFETKKSIDTDLKLIAFYLPQFHPIPQNDKAWGKGFTEWTNVTKATPQFEGQYQPRLPGELGYYDLRLKEIQARQIELAKNYGLHGFCYHYYWFDGEKVMDKPLQQILDNPDLDFPFCINWANENWTKRWDGMDNDVILAQNHTPEDDIEFLEAIKPILLDKRYIKVNNKPLLMVYRPNKFPDVIATVKRWRKQAKEIGIGELYLVLSHAFDPIDPRELGFDAATEFAPNNFPVKDLTDTLSYYNMDFSGKVHDYSFLINASIGYNEPEYTKFRSIFPSWDNEARKPGRGTSFLNTTPASYAKWLEHLLYFTNENRKGDEKIVFINAWNEWAEGCYLEPDRRYGYSYLNATHKTLEKFDSNKLELLKSTQKIKKCSDTAIILHLYYVDLWEEIYEHLKNFKEPVDLYININNNASISEIEKIRKDYPSANLYSYENRGRDILPFLHTLEIVLKLQYKYICKIHSKKSLHLDDGGKWRDQLIKNIIGTTEQIKKSKNYLDNGAGVVVAKNNSFSYQDWVGSNEAYVNKLAEKANIIISEDFLFPAGSMFWFNPLIFKNLNKYIQSNEFRLEEGQLDGTIAHAVERIVGLLCHENKLSIEEV
jgi:lipopolysaccharide biosynthesis protein